MTPSKKKPSVSLYVVKRSQSSQNQMNALHQRWQQIRKLERNHVHIDECKNQYDFIKQALEEQNKNVRLDSAKNDAVH
tara:strand:+ start:5385 stop:5618 length:234 start_codon:yes stop_codon:yes gene_type:complete